MTQSTKEPLLNVLPLKTAHEYSPAAICSRTSLLRATNFTEVNLGYSEELARQEALRCLECARARNAPRLVPWG